MITTKLRKASSPSDADAVTDGHDSFEAYVLKKKRKKLWWVVVPLIVIASVALVWAVWFSSIFAIDQVRAVSTDGGSLADAQVAEVIRTAALIQGEPIAWVDAGGAAQAVANLSWVDSVEVRRGWPNEVVIAVTPREAVARVVVQGTNFAVDTSGVVFDLPTADAATLKGLPRVNAEGDALVAAVQVYQSLPESIRTKVAAMDAASRDGVELTLRSGSTVRWGSSDEPEFKSQVLEALLTRRAEIYDVSAPELPTTTNEKGPKKS